MLDFHSLLAVLAESRPVFHSEADFQHSLAWCIQQSNPAARLRLEVPIKAESGRGRLDIVVASGTTRAVIELKYKTRRGRVEHDGETFDIGDHRAPDFGRYDFLKDVERVESLVAKQEFDFGFAVLTNDPDYWSELNPRENDASFHLSPSRLLCGELAWHPDTGEGTTRERKNALTIIGTHKCIWREYSRVQLDKHANFRYLMLQATA